MIKIPKIVSGNREFPSREFTQTEIESVAGIAPIATWIDASDYIYFYSGDENSPEWQLYQSHLTGNIDIVRSIRISHIDERTRQLIDQGFSFGGKQFSLSDNAQRNWIGIQAGIAGGLIGESLFPFELSTKDDELFYLQWENRNEFLGVVLQGISGPKKSGSILKQQILDCETIEEIDAVIDTR